MPRYDEDDLIDDEEGIEEPYDDWTQPPWWQNLLPLVAALVVGVIIGVVVGAQVFTSGGTVSAASEGVLVLASELHKQGESIEAIREHLDAIGIESPAPALIKLADEYGATDDLRKKRQSEDLRALGEAFLTAAPPTGTAIAAAPNTPAAATPTKVITSSGVVTGTTSPTKPAGQATPTKSPTQSTAPTPTKAPVQDPAPTPTRTTSAAPTSTPTTSSSSGDAARITSSGGEGAILRKSPNTTSTILAYLAHGTRVEVLDTVEGEAIDETEPRWYQIRYNGMVGYVYFKLIAFGE